MLEDSHWGGFLMPSSMSRAKAMGIRKHIQFLAGVFAQAPTVDEPCNLHRKKRVPRHFVDVPPSPEGWERRFFNVTGNGWEYGDGAMDVIQVPRSWGRIVNLGKMKLSLASAEASGVYELCQLVTKPFGELVITQVLFKFGLGPAPIVAPVAAPEVAPSVVP
ncbi:unnamed protein product [Ilex paraguariensis]|uniref:Uncharacterized protein n=1 Tax=Ilex paraguariensis TaxID=185542 RepID=A0ABC8UB61_9AQUA